MKIEFTKEDLNKICLEQKYFVVAYKSFYKIKINGDLYKNGYILEKLATIKEGKLYKPQMIVDK